MSALKATAPVFGGLGRDAQASTRNACAPRTIDRGSEPSLKALLFGPAFSSIA